MSLCFRQNCLMSTVSCSSHWPTSHMLFPSAYTFFLSKSCIFSKGTLDMKKRKVHVCNSIRGDSFFSCPFTCVYIVLLYLLWICSKICSGCLKPQIVTNPIYIMFFSYIHIPFHVKEIKWKLFFFLHIFTASLWHTQIASISTLALWGHY